jgi:carbonic anhydrase
VIEQHDKESIRERPPMPTTLKPEAALQALVDGNNRTVDGSTRAAQFGTARREELSSGQSPFATVLGCADSRVPPELVFDAGLGDIFDVRNAGQIADDVALGSIEYSVAVLGVPLVLVLRHTACGAVAAAVAGGDVPAPHIGAVIEAIAPSVHSAGDGASAEAVGAAHLEATLRTILERSGLVSDRVAEGRLALAGGTYDLATGQVTIDTVIGAR